MFNEKEGESNGKMLDGVYGDTGREKGNKRRQDIMCALITLKNVIRLNL